jgi:T4 RnlA family RNA ligase
MTTPKIRVMEAALRRVAGCARREALVLRGGLLSRAWLGPALRSADDLDFLVPAGTPGPYPWGPALTHEVFAAALGADLGDGVAFDLARLEAAATWEETDAPGVRLQVEATVDGEGPVLLQIDVGFGDPMDPGPAEYDFPFSQGAPASVRAARPETALAWKVHGLFEHRDGRWRPKDLWDVKLLLEHLPMDPEALLRALPIAFSSRHTPLVVTRRLLDGGFGASAGSRAGWRGFRRAFPTRGLPETAAPVIAEVARALRPHLERLLDAQRARARAVEVTSPRPEGCAFPAVRSLADVLPAIAGRPEFAVYRRGGLTSLTYERLLKDTFPDPEAASDPETARLWALRRECRGLIFDGEGRLIARKFHKFFNVDEREEARLEQIDWSAGALAMEKLDGSMIAPVPLGERLLWTTKRGPSEISEQAAAHTVAHPGDYAGLCERWVADGYTPLFEWCSRQHRLVMDHPEDRLVLLAVRHNLHGHYLPWEEVAGRAAAAGVPLPAQWARLSDPGEAAAFVAQIRAAGGLEGAVLCFADGRRYKVKSQKFRRLHHAVEGLDQERPVWRVVLAGEIDDLLPALDGAQRARAEGFADALERAMVALTERVEAVVAERRAELEGLQEGEARAALAQRLGGLGQDERSLAFRIWDGAAPREATQALVEGKLGTARGLRHLQALLGVRWLEESG